MNIGIVYDSLSRMLSEASVSKDMEASHKILCFLKKHFDLNSEISKEFKILNVLTESNNIHSNSVAFRILDGAKSASRMLNKKKLNAEKKSLAEDLEITFPNFDYESKYLEREIGVQLLLEWAKDDITRDLVKTARLEDSIKEHLLVKEATLTQQIKTPTDPLVVKLMTEKVNQKWSKILNESQKDLLKTYIFADDRKYLVKKLEDIRKDSLQCVESYAKKQNNSDRWLRQKLTKTKDMILSESIEKNDITDKTISRFMDILKLIEEIEKPESKNSE